MSDYEIQPATFRHVLKEIFARPKHKREKSPEEIFGAFFRPADDGAFQRPTYPFCLQTGELGHRLKCLVWNAQERHFVESQHLAVAYLSHLISEGESYFADIDIRSISSVSASDGEFINDLDELPETTHLRSVTNGPNGAIDCRALRILRRAVYNHLPADGPPGVTFAVREHSWDGRRVVLNNNAARRFAYWRRLAHLPGVPRRVRARITPLILNEPALDSLIQRWRVCEVETSYSRADSALILLKLWPEGPTFIPQKLGARSQKFWIVPLPHLAPPPYVDALVDLHAEIDQLRVFEPLRTLAEQRIQMTLKRPWLPD